MLNTVLVYEIHVIAYVSFYLLQFSAYYTHFKCLISNLQKQSLARLTVHYIGSRFHSTDTEP